MADETMEEVDLRSEIQRLKNEEMAAEIKRVTEERLAALEAEVTALKPRQL